MLFYIHHPGFLIICTTQPGFIMRIAILADLHYSSSELKTCNIRETGSADIILRRAVFRLNRLIKPDLTILAGDLVNRGGESSGETDMQVIAEQLKLLQSRLIVIPGNHDGEVEKFYQYFPRPEPIEEIGGIRFVVNTNDEEQPRYNSWRSPQNIELITQARQGFSGPVVTLQHTPCTPYGTNDCPYNYTNSDEINAIEGANGVLLSISGHYHRGFKAYRSSNQVTYFAAPALCEPPFCITFADIDVDSGAIEWHTENLQLDHNLGLIDTHIHTDLAYCSENLSLAKIRYMADMFGLKSFRLSEHSGHLLCAKARYRTAQYQPTDFLPEEYRGNQYFDQALAADIPPEHIGLEADIRYDGTFLGHPDDLARAGFRLGAIHEMGCLAERKNISQEELRDQFLWHCQQIINNGCMTLAHPFRVFRRAGVEIPPGCFEPLVKMLKASGTAAEINFHTNEPPVEFFQLAINAGVKLTLGSDTHNLYEIGDFGLHLDFLKKCGVESNYEEVLLPLN